MGYRKWPVTWKGLIWVTEEPYEKNSLSSRVPLADLYLTCVQTQDIKGALPKSYDVHDYINV